MNQPSKRYYSTFTRAAAMAWSAGFHGHRVKVGRDPGERWHVLVWQ